MGELTGGSVAGANLRIDAKFANFPGDQVTILTARIENGDLSAYFDIL